MGTCTGLAMLTSLGSFSDKTLIFWAGTTEVYRLSNSERVDGGALISCIFLLYYWHLIARTYCYFVIVSSCTKEYEVVIPYIVLVDIKIVLCLSVQIGKDTKQNKYRLRWHWHRHSVTKWFRICTDMPNPLTILKRERTVWVAYPVVGRGVRRAMSNDTRELGSTWYVKALVVFLYIRQEWRWRTIHPQAIILIVK